MTAVATFSGVSFEYPNERALFKDLNLSFESKTYALVGPNGVGKTTFARLLSGQLEPTTGRVRLVGTASYVAQRLTPSSLAISDYLPTYHPLIDGLDLDRLCTELSGGQWMRVRIAKALSEEPALLILDEPTNDLDRSAREFVRTFLQLHTGCVLLISHDREILELADETIELSNRGVKKVGGGYALYSEEKRLEREALKARLVQSKHERDKVSGERDTRVRRQEKRTRAGAKSAKGSLPKILIGARKRAAEKTAGRVDVETSRGLEQAVEDAHQAFEQMKIESAMYLDLPEVRIPSQKLVVEVRDLNLRYAPSEDWLFGTDLNFTLKGPSRTLIRGENGSGKSTLLRALFSVDAIEVEHRGELRRGQLATLFLDQRLDHLDDEMSVLENVQRSSSLNETEIRNGLARFLFQKTAVFQKAKDLSGGERLRLALACGYLCGEPPELIVLDEPTNNLDLVNIEYLERLLSAFGGALVVISHDERFVKNLDLDREITCSRGGGRR